MHVALGPTAERLRYTDVSVEPQEELRIVGRLACKTPDDAKRATETLNALAVIAQNAADTQRERIPQNSPDAAATATAFKLIDKCLASRKITTNGNDVQIETTIGKTDDAVKMIVETLAPAVKAARAAAQRTTSMNNLKQIGLAMHNYLTHRSTFPPAVLIGPDGKTPHSWRVALLPYMDQATRCTNSISSISRGIRPTIAKCWSRCRTCIGIRSDDAGSLSTSYFVLTGPDTVFPTARQGHEHCGDYRRHVQNALGR